MDAAEMERVLGRNVRAVRIAQGLRQVDLADLANVSLGALKHLEAGVGSSTSTLVKVLRALGREGWLDTLAPDPEPFNPLALLAEREQGAKAPKGPPRVRRHRAGASP